MSRSRFNYEKHLFLVLFRGLCQPRSPLRLVNRANSWFNRVFLWTQWIHWESWTRRNPHSGNVYSERRGARVRGTLVIRLLRFHPCVSSTASVDDNDDGVITRISFEPFVQLAIRVLLYQITVESICHFICIYIYTYWRKNEKGERRIIYKRKYKYIYNFDTNILSPSISRWIKRGKENRENGERGKERELSNYSFFLAALNE